MPLIPGDRTSEGLNLLELKANLSEEQSVVFTSELNVLREKGWIADGEAQICLTDKGKLYADGIASMLFIG